MMVVALKITIVLPIIWIIIIKSNKLFFAQMAVVVVFGGGGTDMDLTTTEDFALYLLW